ncbi:MAG: type II toxin-antitoxin system VapC family toxin [Burkholderiales bacterium]|nr:type II toxin-antitoxin system VapC family toxin [Burkholderiales bacterium]
MSRIYVDTSVLAKRYLRGPASDDIDDWLDGPAHRFLVSDLVVVELESVVARRARELQGGLDRNQVRLRIDDDMRSGFFAVHTLDTSVLISARRLIAEGPPLATLDALHLASAIDGGADVLATDDRQLARAARDAGLQVRTFEAPENGR